MKKGGNAQIIGEAQTNKVYLSAANLSQHDAMSIGKNLGANSRRKHKTNAKLQQQTNKALSKVSVLPDSDDFRKQLEKKSAAICVTSESRSSAMAPRPKLSTSSSFVNNDLVDVLKGNLGRLFCQNLFLQ